MIRILAATAVAAAALATPAGAACQHAYLGHRYLGGACAEADPNLSGATVDPTVEVDCWAGTSPACSGNPVSVGRTGTDATGRVWVAGRQVAPKAEPVEVYCRDVRVRLQYVVAFCLSYDTSGGTPVVTWECTLRRDIPCGTGPIDPVRTNGVR